MGRSSRTERRGGRQTAQGWEFVHIPVDGVSRLAYAESQLVATCRGLRICVRRFNPPGATRTAGDHRNPHEHYDRRPENRGQWDHSHC
jgi:hypothetical protein